MLWKVENMHVLSDFKLQKHAISIGNVASFENQTKFFFFFLLFTEINLWNVQVPGIVLYYLNAFVNCCLVFSISFEWFKKKLELSLDTQNRHFLVNWGHLKKIYIYSTNFQNMMTFRYHSFYYFIIYEIG